MASTQPWVHPLPMGGCHQAPGSVHGAEPGCQAQVPGQLRPVGSCLYHSRLGQHLLLKLLPRPLSTTALSLPLRLRKKELLK